MTRIVSWWVPESTDAESDSAQPHHAGTPALVASLVLHVLLLTLAGWTLARRSGGTGAPADRRVGIAMVQRLPDRDRYVDAAEVTPQPSENPNDAAASAAAAPPADLTPPVDLDGVLQAMTETPVPVSGSGLSGDMQVQGDDLAGGIGSGAPQELASRRADLFGVSGYGSRFVYVMDRSDSMNGFSGRPIRAAKSELRRSLETLSELQQFQIIFYNDKPRAFRASGTVSLIQGESNMVEAAKQFVDSVRAFGGTEHAIALKLALRMNPDVIFFLTDARIPRLSTTELLEIRNRAARSGTTIHAIEFGSEPSPPTDSFLMDLANQNGGQYQYIDVQRL